MTSTAADSNVTPADTAVSILRGLAAEWRGQTVEAAVSIRRAELLERLDKWRTWFEELDEELCTGGPLPGAWQQRGDAVVKRRDFTWQQRNALIALLTTAPGDVNAAILSLNVRTRRSLCQRGFIVFDGERYALTISGRATATALSSEQRDGAQP